MELNVIPGFVNGSKVVEPDFVRFFGISEAEETLGSRTYCRERGRLRDFVPLLNPPCSIRLLSPWSFLLLAQSDKRVHSADPMVEFVLVAKVVGVLADEVRYGSPFFQMVLHLLRLPVVFVQVKK